MQQILCFLLLCLPLFAITQEDSIYNGIRFQEGLSWQEVKAKAKSESKYIFLDIYATWCAPCKIMDKEVYPNDTVGKIMNDKFICVKVQIDSTKIDNESVKGWYADAKKINQEYSIAGYPSFLFLSSDGRLAYKGLGYKNVHNFVRMVSQALDPQNPEFYSQLENYQNGKKDYNSVGSLAVFVNQVITDKQLAQDMAIDYKENFLDKVNEQVLLTKQNLDFINEFNALINSKDVLFYLCYTQPNRIDSIVKAKGWASFQVEQVIRREELSNKLLKNKKPLYKNPKLESNRKSD